MSCYYVLYMYVYIFNLACVHNVVNKTHIHYINISNIFNEILHYSAPGSLVDLSKSCYSAMLLSLLVAIFFRLYKLNYFNILGLLLLFTESTTVSGKSD